MFVDPYENIVRKALRKWFEAKNSGLRRESIRTINFQENGQRVQEKDPNYIAFNRRIRGNMPRNVFLRDVASDLKIYVDKLEDVDYRPSVERILEVLLKWSSSQIECKSYMLDPEDMCRIIKLNQVTWRGEGKAAAPSDQTL